MNHIYFLDFAFCQQVAQDSISTQMEGTNGNEFFLKKIGDQRCAHD